MQNNAISLFDFAAMNESEKQMLKIVAKNDDEGKLKSKVVRVTSKKDIQAQLELANPEITITKEQVAAKHREMGDRLLSDAVKMLSDMNASENWTGANVAVSFGKNGRTVRIVAKEAVNKGPSLETIAKAYNIPVEQVQAFIKAQQAKLLENLAVDIEATTESTETAEAGSEASE